MKTLSMRPDKLQTIQPDDFRHLAEDFHVTLPWKNSCMKNKREACLQGIRKPPGAMERYETLDCQPGAFL